MSLMQEVVLDRLWSKYEHRFGHPPPITSASLDDAIAVLRRDLDRAPDRGAAALCHNDIGNSGKRPITAP
jgi:hypothetical protein